MFFFVIGYLLLNKFGGKLNLSGYLGASERNTTTPDIPPVGYDEGRYSRSYYNTVIPSVDGSTVVDTFIPDTYRDRGTSMRIY